jgi:hypothetical protein
MLIEDFHENENEATITKMSASEKMLLKPSLGNLGSAKN